MTVFADTYALIAWLNPADNGHDAVTRYLSDFGGKLVTTEWVLMEVADALASPPARQKAVEFLRSVRADRAFEIVGYESPAYEAGVKLFSSRPDKDWSLTDCISFEVMRQRGLTDALTEDKHFTQAGFRAVFAKGATDGLF